jgi:hypothetical protein
MKVLFSESLGYFQGRLVWGVRVYQLSSRTHFTITTLSQMEYI